MEQWKAYFSIWFSLKIEKVISAIMKRKLALLIETFEIRLQILLFLSTPPPITARQAFDKQDLCEKHFLSHLSVAAGQWCVSKCIVFNYTKWGKHPTTGLLRQQQQQSGVVCLEAVVSVVVDSQNTSNRFQTARLDCFIFSARLICGISLNNSLSST